MCSPRRVELLWNILYCARVGVARAESGKQWPGILLWVYLGGVGFSRAEALLREKHERCIVRHSGGIGARSAMEVCLELRIRGGYACAVLGHLGMLMV